MPRENIKATIRGIEEARKALKSLGGKHLGYAKKLSLLRAGTYLNKQITKNITLHDHSLDTLAFMGHPYARRHGNIGVHQEKPFVVHSQTGRLAGTLHYTMKGGIDNPIFRTGLKYNRRYTRYVITGTKVMLPRSVLYATSQDEAVRKKMVELVLHEMKKYAAARAKGGLKR